MVDADLSTRRAALSANQRDLVAQRLRARVEAGSEGRHSIPCRGGGGLVPLSFAQQRLWFLDQLVPGSALYNVPFALRLAVPVDVGVLGRALSAVVERHEALRTVFPAVGGSPRQVVLAAAVVPIEVVDLSGGDLVVARREAELLAGEDARRPFDLAAGPLLRARLVRLGAAEHVFLLTLHHIVADGWSMTILFRELSALYQAFAAGRPSPLAPLAVQYADFAVWQREVLGGEVLEGQLAYWRDRLADLAVLDLPTDRPRVPLERYAGAVLPVALPAALTGQLKSLAAAHGATQFMALVAGLACVLSRWADTDDVVVGSPIAGRTRPELEPLIGFFVNTLVLRVDLSGNPSFDELLDRVRSTAVGAYAHQDLPFEMLVEHLAPTRDLSRNPLFQILIQLQTNTADPAQTPLEIDRGTAASEHRQVKFDLSFDFVETGDTVHGVIEYSTELFDRSTLERMVAQLVTLLEDAVARPQTAVGELQLLPLRQRRQLLAEFNATATEFTPRCLHHLIEDQTRASPTATALIYGDVEVSYAELDSDATRLAHHLVAHGVRRGDIVGVCLQRSPQLVVAIVAVLKAGAAYLPLDPTYPAERLAFMLTDAAAPVLLTTTDLTSNLPTTPTTHVIHLDTAQPDAPTNPPTIAATAPPAIPATTPDDLAYCIYTSGSTGQPKGVLIEHRAASNHMQWMVESLPIVSSDRVLQRTPISFDASVWEIFATLQAGAAIVLPDAGAANDTATLATTIRDRRVSILQVVPSLLRPLLDEPSLAECRSLRCVCAGGEPLPLDLQDRFARQLDAELWNLYGPAEATVDATAWRCLPLPARALVPIGRPIANVEAYVVDRHRRLVPIGVPGELLLGGVGLARGYHQRPELTAERFVDNPFQPGTRLYRTGDLVRWRDDGALEYLGRNDDQVKVRGFRIELGEIETQLGRHGDVADAAAAVRCDQNGEPRLVAYVVARGGRNLVVERLREHVGERLPGHMVPDRIVTLPALPVTTSGKLDRAALPPLDGQRPELEGSFVAPRSEQERRIARIWQHVLGIDDVGVNDNFFDLGGHSLLLITVHALLRDEVSPDLTMLDLFRFPTVRSLAASLAAGDAESMAPQTVLSRASQRAASQRSRRDAVERRVR